MVQKHRPTRPKAPSLANALQEFLLDARARQFTGRTLEHYRGRLGAFVRWAADQDPTPATVADVTPALVRLYLVHLQARRLASNTQHTHARALRAWLNWCKREGWLAESPFDKVQMPRADKVQKDTFTDDQVRRLVRACETARERALVLLLMDTGMRASELCGLDIGDFDADAGTVAIRLGKGRKDRRAFVGANTARALVRHIGERTDTAPGAPLFTSEAQRNFDGRLTRSGLYRIIHYIGERAGVEHCHPHRFRRTFATWALAAGMDVYSLAALMGHSDIDTLKHYLRLGQRELQRAHTDAGPVDRLFRK